MPLKEKYLIETLASEEHQKWSRWIRYIFSKCKQDKEGNMIIPAYYVYSWIRKGTGNYNELEDNDKNHFKIEARNTLKIVNTHLFSKDKKENEEQQADVSKEIP